MNSKKYKLTSKLQFTSIYYLIGAISLSLISVVIIIPLIIFGRKSFTVPQLFVLFIFGACLFYPLYAYRRTYQYMVVNNNIFLYRRNKLLYIVDIDHLYNQKHNILKPRHGFIVHFYDYKKGRISIIVDGYEENKLCCFLRGKYW